MSTEEKEFQEYMFLHKDNFTIDKVNQAYWILNKKSAPTGCNSCVEKVARELKTKYILLLNATCYSGEVFKKDVLDDGLGGFLTHLKK